MWFNGPKFLWRSEESWVEEAVDFNLTPEDLEIKSIIKSTQLTSQTVLQLIGSKEFKMSENEKNFSRGSSNRSKDKSKIWSQQGSRRQLLP